MKRQAEMISKEIDIQLGQGKKCIEINDLSMIYMELLLCNLKELSWNYENEFRCTTGARAKGMPYINARPKEIYVGYKCREEHSKKLIKIGEKLGIPIYKMKYEENMSNYELGYEAIYDNRINEFFKKQMRR